MNIKEYSESIRKKLKGQAPTDFDWRHAYDARGYPNVLLGKEGHAEWNEVHRWCEIHIGEQHYSWTGSRFWFDNVEAAALFALRWS